MTAETQEQMNPNVVSQEKPVVAETDKETLVDSPPTETMEIEPSVEQETEEQETEEQLEPEEATKRANELAQQADVATKESDFGRAVTLLSKAIEYLDAAFGQMDERVAEVAFLYGKALVRNAIQTTGVFGESEKAQKVLEAVEKGLEAEGEINQGASGSNPTEEEEKAVDGIAEELEDDEEEEIDLAEQEAADENDDFETAWNILDWCRVLLKKREETPETMRILGDVHIWLGDISFENEVFEQAQTDYKEAVRLWIAGFGEGAFELSEAYYKLGMSFDYHKQKETALEWYEKSLDIVKKSGKENTEDVVKDLESKIFDLKNGTVPIQEEAPVAAFGEAQNLSGLVRKRKAEDEEEVEKKQKSE